MFGALRSEPSLSARRRSLLVGASAAPADHRACAGPPTAGPPLSSSPVVAVVAVAESPSCRRRRPAAP
ncbi:hypothetical protein MXD62_18505 [Frankia sp. Mgl5]|uniref:hypothetical protein n=1 Tax=Frankia sp. Mgl5 TaxID=2933793 RepID=UPI00200CC0C7|nr:hypothetical protein [Frankia sp. Mgl5]MCK9929142.1 hypothetical protein [Frankia sp. Mgl5]